MVATELQPLLYEIRSGVQSRLEHLAILAAVLFIYLTKEPYEAMACSGVLSISLIRLICVNDIISHPNYKCMHFHLHG